MFQWVKILDSNMSNKYSRRIPHTPEEKKKVLLRLARINGQTNALVRAIDINTPCSDLLQQIAALRGAVNSLMVEVLGFHLKDFALNAKTSSHNDLTQNITATKNQLGEIVKLLSTYLK